MKSAIVGMGVIGKVHYDVLRELGIEIVALCDVDEDKLNGFSQTKYNDYNAMIEKETIDVVHICTPHYLHADMIISALDKNINVLCEKPLCIREEDIPRILDAEKRSKAKLGVCHQNRYTAVNSFVKEYIKDKHVIGGHATMSWQRTAEYYKQAEWRGKWQTEGGGVLINQALHTLDLLIWYIGEPKDIKANIANNTLKEDVEVEDTACIIADGDVKFCFFATNGAPTHFPVNVALALDNEQIFIYLNKVIIGDKEYDFNNDDKVYGKRCYGVGHKGLFSDFYDAVKTGRDFSVDGKEAAKVIRIILEAYKNKLQ